MISQELSQFIQRFVQGVEPEAMATVEGIRLGMDQMASSIPFPEVLRSSEVNAGGVPSVWIEDAGTDTGRTLIYLHGGGYIAGSFLSQRELAARIAQSAEAKVLFPLYRLAPEHPFPAALEDVVTAYRWLLENQGIPPAAISIAGDSAGGGLALAALMVIRDRGLPLPAAAAVMSPWTDLACCGTSYLERATTDPFLKLDGLQAFAQMYSGGEDLRNPLISPLYGDLAGLPPLLVQVGSCEILYDDAAELVNKARQAGVNASLEVEDGLYHVFQIVHNAPEALRATQRMGEFLKKHTVSQPVTGS